MREEIRYFPQHTGETCGISCCLMLLDYYRANLKYPTVNMEEDLYNKYGVEGYMGTTGAAIADCLSRNHLYIHLVQSFTDRMDDGGTMFTAQELEKINCSHREHLTGCECGIRFSPGQNFDCAFLRQELESGKKIILQWVVPKVENGPPSVLHWVVLERYKDGRFRVRDPIPRYKLWNLTEAEMETLMTTPIGRICIVVRESRVNTLDSYIKDSLPRYRKDVDKPEKKMALFETNPNLNAKVRGDKLLPYYGNTAVFLLKEETKKRLSDLQKELYRKAGWMLAEKLQPGTFHMTLHDLVNGPRQNDALLEEMARAEEKARILLEQWKDLPPIRMRATYLFNMVNTSVVLGLAPADRENRKRLDDMYTALNEVVPLPHALTPHITLAYYRPGTYTAYDVECLREALHRVELGVTLDMKDLVLQTFTDMNSYETVF